VEPARGAGAQRQRDILRTVSNTDPAPEAVSLRAGVMHAVDVLEARKAAIGDGTEVRRLAAPPLPPGGLKAR
jgi:hypothetical protein